MYLAYTQNFYLEYFSCSIKYITLCGDQVLNIRDLHNDLSILLSAAMKSNIEVLSPLLDLYISSPFRALIFPPTDEIIH